MTQTPAPYVAAPAVADMPSVYDAANLLLRAIAAAGQIDLAHPAVGTLMDALHAEDGGTPRPGPRRTRLDLAAEIAADPDMDETDRPRRLDDVLACCRIAERMRAAVGELYDLDLDASVHLVDEALYQAAWLIRRPPNRHGAGRHPQGKVVLPEIGTFEARFDAGTGELTGVLFCPDVRLFERDPIDPDLHPAPETEEVAHARG